MTGPASETPAVLHGLRCRNPHHPNSGQVYGIRPYFGHLVSLAEDGCSELVVSRDDGATWTAVPIPTLAEAKAKLEGGAWQREAERLRAELEQVRAELAVVTGERDDALLLVQDGMPEPCQPIGCDNGHHLAGCVYAAADAEEVSGRE